MKNSISCQSCGMPILKDDDYSTNADRSQNGEYCAYCYKDGAFTKEMSLDEMIEVNLQYLRAYRDNTGRAYSEEETREMLREWMQTLKRWR